MIVVKIVILGLFALLISFGMVTQSYAHTTVEVEPYKIEAGWSIEPPEGTMFAWAPIPEPYKHMGSIEFASWLVKEAKVATSPGVGFGPGGEGYVRFALIENEQRISQAIRHIKNTLTDL